jgi:hypothetical protein
LQDQERLTEARVYYVQIEARLPSLRCALKGGEEKIAGAGHPGEGAQA